jgi:hypothetical protein
VSTPDSRPSPPSGVPSGLDMHRLPLALLSVPRLRCESSAPTCQVETRSAHAVSHDYDGLLHTRGVGLLHPTANLEVRLVAGHPTTLAPHRPPTCRHLAVPAAERPAPIPLRRGPKTCRCVLASRSGPDRGQVRSATGDRGCTPSWSRREREHLSRHRPRLKHTPDRRRSACRVGSPLVHCGAA